MSDLYNYIRQYVTDPDAVNIVMSCIMVMFVSFGIQIFGWIFGRR